MARRDGACETVGGTLGRSGCRPEEDRRVAKALSVGSGEVSKAQTRTIIAKAPDSADVHQWGVGGVLRAYDPQILGSVNKHVRDGQYLGAPLASQQRGSRQSKVSSCNVLARSILRRVQ